MNLRSFNEYGYLAHYLIGLTNKLEKKTAVADSVTNNLRLNEIKTLVTMYSKELHRIQNMIDDYEKIKKVSPGEVEKETNRIQIFSQRLEDKISKIKDAIKNNIFDSEKLSKIADILISMVKELYEREEHMKNILLVRGPTKHIGKHIRVPAGLVQDIDTHKVHLSKK